MFSIRELKELAESFEKQGSGDVQEFLLFVASKDYTRQKENVRAIIEGMTNLIKDFPDMGKNKADVAVFLSFAAVAVASDDYVGLL